MAIDYMCVYGHQTEHYSLSGGVCYMYTYIVECELTHHTPTRNRRSGPRPSHTSELFTIAVHVLLPEHFIHNKCFT